jgi:hypothetical protein
MSSSIVEQKIESSESLENLLKSQRLEFGRNIRWVGSMWRHALLLGVINLSTDSSNDWIFFETEKFLTSIHHDQLVDWKYLISVSANSLTIHP